MLVAGQTNSMVSRRELLGMAGAAAAWLGTPRESQGFAIPDRTRLSGAPTAFALRNRAGRGGGQPLDMVEHCHKLGLGGVQTNPPATDPEAIKKFRARLEEYNLYLISDPRLPRQESDLPAFEAQVKAYKEAGAVMFHAAMTGRRYEDFDSLEAWKKMFDNSQKIIQMAEPVLRKYQMKLANENHKGWRAAEQAAWLKRLGSEWVGVCLDFGNNISLCEDPMDTLKTLAPYTFFAHIKDMAVQEYEDGFLLSEVVMGDGFLDLKGMVQTLRQKDPKMIFALEMITRDPLKIPVYTDKYWATFDDMVSPLPGRDLAKVLNLVRKNKPKKPLPKITGLSPAEQIKLEDDLNQKCIDYAHQNLAM